MKTNLSKEAQDDLKRIRVELKKPNPDGELLNLLLNGPKYNVPINPYQ